MGKKDNEVPETEAERALAEVSIQKWNDHQRRMVPLENKIIERATRSPYVAGVKAAGAVNADMAQATPALANPNSRQGYVRNILPVAKAASKAAVDAGQTVHDQRASALGNVVAMGEGKSATATAGFETAAANATSKAINDAVTSQQNRHANANAIGSLVGVGAYAATKPKAAGALADFTPGGAQDAVRAGASTGPGGYNVRGDGSIYWND